MRLSLAILKRIGRTILLLTLVALGTMMLMRFAPGYFSDAREMDAKYGSGARSELRAEQAQRGSLGTIASGAFTGWLHGDLGQSRQFEIPVSELLRPRLRVSASLLIQGVGYGWIVAFCSALPLSAARGGATWLGAPFTVLLAIPTAAMATLCLLSSTGGPVLVLTLLLAARDFKFLHGVLRVAWRSPHLLQARAQGLRVDQLVRGHLLPEVLPQMLALASLSLITALSAIVPVEVIFNVPGVGQLAWTAAMNRDLPVLLTVTLLMAISVVCAGMFSAPIRSVETA
jgi:peptide/nickel transport system permease protein